MNIPEELKKRAIDEIATRLKQMIKSVVGHEPTDLENIETTAERWLSELIASINDPILENFEEITDSKIRTEMQQRWAKHHFTFRVLKAQIYGVSEETARQLVLVTGN